MNSSSPAPECRVQSNWGEWLTAAALLFVCCEALAAVDPQPEVARQIVQAAQQPIEAPEKSGGQKLAQDSSNQPNRGVVQLLNQVEALNGELNRLRGQIEVLSNDINNAQKRQRDMYIDLDTRLRRLEQSTAKKEPDARIGAIEERIRKLEQASSAQTGVAQPVSADTTVPGENPPAAAVQSGAAAAVSAAPASPGPSNSLPPASLSTTDQAAIQRTYDNAYSTYRLGEYASAIRGFDNFTKSYPAHSLAANALYWIGESHAHLRQYREAIEAQRRLLASYPDSPKAPDALLIIGTAESNLGENSSARKTFEEIIAGYPASESAQKAKARLAKLK